MKKLLFYICSLTLLVTLYSCVPSQPENEEVETLSYDRLIKRLEVNRRKIKNFLASGTIDIKNPTFDNSASFRIFIAKPDSLYMNILGPLNIEIAQILIIKDDFKFYEVLSNKLYKGKLDNNIIKSAFKADLNFKQLVDVMLGAVNLSDKISTKISQFNIDEDKYVFNFSDSYGDTTLQETYKIRIKNLGIVDYQIKNRSNNSIVYKSSFDDFITFGGSPVPKKIAINDSKNNQEIKIKYKKIEVNVKNYIIDFDIPDDAEIIDIR